jgi:hypothetical protein
MHSSATKKGEAALQRPRVIAACACLAAFIGLCAFSYGKIEERRRRTGIPKDEIFERLIASPIPKEVTELQAAGITWQGYGIYLRFRAPSLAAAGFEEPPYQPVDCAEILHHFELPPQIRSLFSPEWSVPASPARSCLEAYELRNDWTTLGSHRVMYANGWAHFVGFGS